MRIAALPGRDSATPNSAAKGVAFGTGRPPGAGAAASPAT